MNAYLLRKYAASVEEDPIGTRLAQQSGIATGLIGTSLLNYRLRGGPYKNNAKDTYLNTDKGIRKTTRDAYSIAKRLGFKDNPSKAGELLHKRRSSPLAVSVGKVNESMFLPQGNPFDTKYFKGPKMFNGAPVREGVHIGKFGLDRTKGMIAHEFGHSLQSRGVQRLGAVGKSLRHYTPRLIAGAALINPDIDNKELAILGTMGGLAELGVEAHASALGSRAFKSRARKLQAFKGLPSYAALAAAPAVTYLGSKLFKPEH